MCFASTRNAEDAGGTSSGTDLGRIDRATWPRRLVSPLLSAADEQRDLELSALRDDAVSGAHADPLHGEPSSAERQRPAAMVHRHRRRAGICRPPDAILRAQDPHRLRRRRGNARRGLREQCSTHPVNRETYRSCRVCQPWRRDVAPSRGCEPQERAALGAFRYQKNIAVLHRDPRVMPRSRRCWSSWIYTSDGNLDDPALSVTYWMNSLAGHSRQDAAFRDAESQDADRARTDVRRPRVRASGVRPCRHRRAAARSGDAGRAEHLVLRRAFAPRLSRGRTCQRGPCRQAAGRRGAVAAIRPAFAEPSVARYPAGAKPLWDPRWPAQKPPESLSAFRLGAL